MKKSIITISCIVVSLCALTPIYAAATTCPSANAIIKQGLNSVERDDDSAAFEVGAINSYGTPQTWAFAVVIPFSDATDETVAKSLASAALPTLSGNPKPQNYNDEGTMRQICIYNINQYVAAAITPISLSSVTHNAMTKALL